MIRQLLSLLALVALALPASAVENQHTARQRIIDQLAGPGLTNRDARFQASVNAVVALWSLTAIDPATFGLLNNATGDPDCSITSGTAALSSTHTPWTSADVGRVIYVQGAGAAGGTLQSTIVTVTDSSHIVLATLASTTVTASASSTGGIAIWGDGATGAAPARQVTVGGAQTIAAGSGDALGLLVTATGSTTARRLGARFAEVANVCDFGAVGDGITDDRAAFVAAEAAGFAAGVPVYMPAKTYAVSGSDRLGFRVSLVGASGAKIKITAPATEFATVSNYTAGGTKATGVAFANFSVDAASGCRGIYLDTADDCSVIGVTVTNAKAAGIGVYSSARVLVERCSVTTVTFASDNIGADGIYCSGCTDTAVVGCRVTDFKRIGIVSEKNGATISARWRCDRNIVTNAHDCDSSAGSQYNAGIWCENTDGAGITRNIVRQIGGNAGQTSGRIRGIDVCGGGTTVPAEIVCGGNDVSVVTTGTAAGVGLAISGTGNFPAIYCEHNKVSDVAQAVSIIAGVGEVVIRDLYVDNLRVPDSTGAVVMIDNNSSRARTITLDHLRFTNVTDPNSDLNWGHITIYSSGAGVTGTMIINDCGSADAPCRLVARSDNSAAMKVTNSHIAFGSNAGYGCLRATDVQCIGDTFTFTSGRSTSVSKLIDNAAAHTLVCTGCVFDGCAWECSGGPSTSQYRFADCMFRNGCGIRLSCTGTFDFAFDGCRIEEYDGTNGFIKTNFANPTRDRLFVRGCDFKRSTDVTPILLWNTAPDVTVLQGNTFTSTLLHNLGAVASNVNNLSG